MKHLLLLLVALTFSQVINSQSKSTPVYHNVQAPSISGKAERIAKFSVSDQSKDVLEIVNATEYNNRFKPTLWAHSQFNDDRAVFRILTTLKSINDTGISPVMMFQAELRNSIYDSYAFPWGSHSAQVQNRPLFAWYNNNSMKMLMKANGNLGIGTANPQEKLHINGSIRGNIGPGALRIKSSTGYIDVGSTNSEWAHFTTDRSKFFFNRAVYTYTGEFSSYLNSNLKLQTHGITRMTVLKSNGNVGIGTTSPTAKLHNNGTVRFQNLPNATGNPTYILGTDANGNVKEYNASTSSGSDVDWLDLSGNTPDSIYDNIYTRGRVGINTTNPTNPLHVYSKILDPVRIEGVVENYDPFMLTIDDNGVLHKIRISNKSLENEKLILKLEETVKNQQKQIDELKNLIKLKLSNINRFDSSKFSSNKLRVYPNPSDREFLVDLSNFKSGNIYVVSTNGNKIYEDLFFANDSYKIDLQNFPSGTYTIVVETSNKIFSKIIIKK